MIVENRCNQFNDLKAIFEFVKQKKMKFRFLLYVLLFVMGGLFGAALTYSLMKEEPEEVSISHSVVIDKIESMGRLEVVKYNIQDIIEYKKMRQWLPNAKTALLINGEIVACIDLTKITEDRVALSGDSIVLYLPEPQVCHVKVDHARSKVYDMTYGLWETTALMDEAYKHAEKELIRQSKNLDFKEKAKENATLVLTPMLHAFGFKHITIMYDESQKLNR